MHPLVEQHRTEIEAICRARGVKRLELFGSAARAKPDPSDFDFFVEFNDYTSPDIADRWFGLDQRPVDRRSGGITVCRGQPSSVDGGSLQPTEREYESLDNSAVLADRQRLLNDRASRGTRGLADFVDHTAAGEIPERLQCREAT